MKTNNRTREELLAENAELRARLADAEETLRAIREGEVDAVIVTGSKGDRVFALSEAENLHRLMVETMNEAGLAAAPDGTLMFCNDRACALLGRPEDQLLGRDLGQFVCPQDAPRLQRLMQTAQGDSADDRILFRGGNGTPVPMHVWASYLDRSDGPLICLVATDLSRIEADRDLIEKFQQQQQQLHDSRKAALNLMQDAVAARQQAEQSEAALRESEERIRALIANLPGGAVFVVDRDLRCRLADGEALHTVGLRPADLEGKPITEAPDAPMAASSESLYRQALAGEPFTQENSSHGRVFHSRGVPLRNEKGKVYAVLAVSYDITERKQAEEALRRAKEELELRVQERTAELTRTNAALQVESDGHRRAAKALAQSEARLQAILDHTPARVFLKDKQGRYLHVNRHFERVSHLPLAEILGKIDTEIFPRRQALLFREHDAKVIEAGVPMQFDEVVLFDDGPHDCMVTRFPLADAQGNIYGVGGITTDITERKRLEAEILQITEREQRRVAQDLHDGLGQHLSGLMHMSSVLHANLAERAAPEAADAGRIATLLREAAEQTRALARGLHPVEMEASGLMASLDHLAVRTSEMFKIDCRFECRRGVLVPDVLAASHLYRIAQEAINNAIKHGRASRIRIELAEGLESITLTVHNNGAVIPKKRSGKEGLGLRIMQYRATILGGSLTIDSNRRRGTTVACTLQKRVAPHKLIPNP